MEKIIEDILSDEDFSDPICGDFYLEEADMEELSEKMVDGISVFAADIIRVIPKKFLRAVLNRNGVITMCLVPETSEKIQLQFFYRGKKKTPKIFYAGHGHSVLGVSGKISIPFATIENEANKKTVKRLTPKKGGVK